MSEYLKVPQAEYALQTVKDWEGAFAGIYNMQNDATYRAEKLAETSQKNIESNGWSSMEYVLKFSPDGETPDAELYEFLEKKYISFWKRVNEQLHQCVPPAHITVDRQHNNVTYNAAYKLKSKPKKAVSVPHQEKVSKLKEDAKIARSASVVSQKAEKKANDENAKLKNQLEKKDKTIAKLQDDKAKNVETIKALRAELRYQKKVASNAKRSSKGREIMATAEKRASK